MEAELNTELDALDSTALTPLVQNVIGRASAEVCEWRWELISTDMYLAGRTVARLSGTARDRNEILPWSLVLKVVRPPPGTAEPRNVHWNREALAYRSGLLTDLPGGLTVPRCFEAGEGDDWAVWMWLEDVADRYSGRWPLSEYRRAARHLGQFNGAYLGTRPLPTFPWLVTRWTERHSEPVNIPEALDEIERLAADSRVGRAFPAGNIDRIVRLLRDQPLFVEILAALPQTLCHHDAARANLFARRRANGAPETVAIDWEALGPGSVGAEIATLVSGTIRRGDFPADRAAALDREVCAGYLQGLRDSG